MQTVRQLQDDGILFVEDGNHGEYRPLAGEFVTDGVPFVRPPDLVCGGVDLAACDKINEVAFARVRKGIGRGGDVLFTHRATVGRLAAMPLDAPTFVCNPGVTVWRSIKPKMLDRRFLYYWMHSAAFMDQVWAAAGGADTFPYIGLQQQRQLRVATPPFPEQQAIAAVLGALDDKIELNRRMNRTLEAMARALFRSWFVDFDPVRAKAEGRAPAHMDPATAALFPARLGEDGLPERWVLSKVEDALELVYGKSLTKDMRQDGPFPVYGSGGVAGTHRDPLVAEPTVVVGRKGTVGSLFWVPRGCFPIDTTYFVRARVPLVYAYRLLETLGLDDMNTDAAVPGLNRSNVYRLQFPNPGEQLMGRFEAEAGLWQRMIDRNGEAGRTLAALRDTLLPKLMSGELRIRDAERALAEAV